MDNNLLKRNRRVARPKYPEAHRRARQVGSMTGELSPRDREASDRAHAAAMEQAFSRPAEPDWDPDWFAWPKTTKEYDAALEQIYVRPAVPDSEEPDWFLNPVQMQKFVSRVVMENHSMNPEPAADLRRTQLHDVPRFLSSPDIDEHAARTYGKDQLEDVPLSATSEASELSLHTPKRQLGYRAAPSSREVSAAVDPIARVDNEESNPLPRRLRVVNGDNPEDEDGDAASVMSDDSTRPLNEKEQAQFVGFDGAHVHHHRYVPHRATSWERFAGMSIAEFNEQVNKAQAEERR